MTEYWDAVDLDDPAMPDVERDFTDVLAGTPKQVVSRGRPSLGPNARCWRATSSMPSGASRPGRAATSTWAAAPTCSRR